MVSCPVLLVAGSVAGFRFTLERRDSPWCRPSGMAACHRGPIVPKDQDDTRPIALLSMAWRAGARAVARRVRSWVTGWCDHRACGSALGKSVSDMHQRIYCAWRQGPPGMPIISVAGPVGLLRC